MMKFFRKYHKWLGLFFALFIIMFAISGILLNHRQALSHFDISRSFLPKSYQFNNWNNGAIIGTVPLSPNSIMMYGSSGVWLADSMMQEVRSCVKGLPSGVDNRNFRAAVSPREGLVITASTHRLYKLASEEMEWVEISQMVPHDGDVYNDLCLKGDTLYVVMRSHIYESPFPYDQFTQIELGKPVDYTGKVPLFRTIWVLHSGELFGILGKVIVDLVGIVVILLTVTGLILIFWKKPMQRNKKNKRLRSTFINSLKWHNKLGSWLFILLLLVGVTGWFLRPPMMITIIRGQTKPFPFSTLDSPNPWHQMLRNLRYDKHNQEWLLYSSKGFYHFRHFEETPTKISLVPPISVMGINVWESMSDSTYLIGSFSGPYEWNPSTGKVYNAVSGTLYDPTEGGKMRPGTLHAPTSGYSSDFIYGTILFDYIDGAYTIDQEKAVPAMPVVIRDEGRLSLWHTALELHVGRLYQPFIFGLTPFYIFFAGLFYLFIIITGYIIYRKRYRKGRKKRKKRDPVQPRI